MKKKYNAPVAEKVDFDYEENVTASGTPSQGCVFGCKHDENPFRPSGFWFFIFWISCGRR